MTAVAAAIPRPIAAVFPVPSINKAQEKEDSFKIQTNHFLAPKICLLVLLTKKRG